MDDKISELRLLTRLVEAGSLSEAARRLYSSPPAVSRRLAQMEGRLGVKLIERSSRRFELTPEGAALHERALRIVAEIDDAEAEASAGRHSPRGRLRISAPMELGRHRIADLIAGFRARYPGIVCELVLSDAGVEVIRDDFDVVLRTTASTEQEAVYFKCLASRRLVCAAPGYLERYGMPATPGALVTDHECLCLVRGRKVYNHWPFRIDGAATTIEVAATMASTSGEVVHQWALAGHGVAVKMLWDIEDDLAAGRLVECLGDYVEGRAFLYMAYAKREYLPARIEAFVDYLRERLVA